MFKRQAIILPSTSLIDFSLPLIIGETLSNFILSAKYGNNLSNDFSPWVRTVGYGIKLPIFLPWRIEAAYDWNEKGFSKPQWYVSLGLDW